jgi:transposase
MTTSMVQEKQRISERLERLDAERAKLSGQLDELEIAERVLARLGAKAATTGSRGRARPAKPGSMDASKRRVRSTPRKLGVSLNEATLKAVQAHDGGATASEVLAYLSRELGMTVRPNHLGMALQRHRRAGRLDNRDQRWHLPTSA